MFLQLLPQAVIFILYLVSLAGPRVPLPSVLIAFFPASVTLNDVLDGLFFSLAAILIFRAMFEGQRLLGFGTLPFLLCLLKAVGHGIHMTANSSDLLLEHDLRAPIGSHVFFFHETIAHNLVYWAEYALLALYLYRAPPGKAPSMPGAIGLVLLGLLQGSAAARLAIGTRTAPSLVSIWLAAAVLSTTSRSNPSARLFAQCLTIASLGFVAYWGAKHNGTWPTFEDLAGSYKR
jgi:hypothetical protein